MSAPRYGYMAGVGGIGKGVLFRFEENDTLGRNESRAARLTDVQDYCKLHIIMHYAAVFAKQRLPVVPIGRLGRDEHGREMHALLEKYGADCRHIIWDDGAPTLYSACFLYPNGEGGNITSSNSASANLAPPQVDAFFDEAPDAPGLVLAAPEVPPNTRLHLLRRGRQQGCTTVASFLPAEAGQFCNKQALSTVDLLSLNSEECRAVARLGGGADGAASGSTSNTDEAVTAAPNDATNNTPAACYAVLRRFNPDIALVVTQGAGPVHLFCQSGHWAFAPLPARVASTAGAGDCLLGVLMAGLAQGMPLRPQNGDTTTSALYPAVAAAALAVESPHSIHFGLNPKTLGQYMQKHRCALAPAAKYEMVELP